MFLDKVEMVIEICLRMGLNNFNTVKCCYMLNSEMKDMDVNYLYWQNQESLSFLDLSMI